jgi:hypothetical protein
MKLKSNSVFKRFIILITLNFIATAFVIYLHTPKPLPLIFDFKCLDTQQICPVKINEIRKNALEKSIKDAVKNSHRLGTLSDAYTSVMRFRVSVMNQSIGYVTIASTTPQKITGDIQCIDGILSYGTKKEVEDYFVLSEMTSDLVTSVTSYVNSCPGFVISQNSLTKLPPVPPNAVLTFEAGPQFDPIFSPDYLSWVLVFMFNSVVIVGLLPIIREGWRFLKKGSDYFTDSKPNCNAF